MGAPEAVVKGEYLSLRQGPHIELLGIDKFRDLLKSYNQLAIAICSFLNGRDGGEVYIGVRRSGEVVGVALTRKQRDDLRQVVDRVLAQMIVPPIPTILVEGRPLVEVNFVPVSNPGGSCTWLHLPQVKAWWGAGRPLCQERSGNRLQECFVAAGRYVLICQFLFVLSVKKMSIDK